MSNVSSPSVPESSWLKAKRMDEIQIQVLEGYFLKKNNPTSEELYRLAKETGIRYERVQIWFQNRRGREKKKYSTENPHYSFVPQYQPSPPPPVAQPTFSSQTLLYHQKKQLNTVNLEDAEFHELG
eukprot:Sdes_comp10617_c0_seq2m2312